MAIAPTNKRVIKPPGRKVIIPNPLSIYKDSPIPKRTPKPWINLVVKEDLVILIFPINVIYDGCSNDYFIVKDELEANYVQKIYELNCN